MLESLPLITPGMYLSCKEFDSPFPPCRKLDQQDKASNLQHPSWFESCPMHRVCKRFAMWTMSKNQVNKGSVIDGRLDSSSQSDKVYRWCFRREQNYLRKDGKNLKLDSRTFRTVK